MQIQLDSASPLSVETEALVTFAFEKDDPIEGPLAELDRATSGRLNELAAGHELTGKWLEMVLLHYPGGLKAKRLLVVGAGKPEKFDNARLRRLAACTVAGDRG